MSKHSDFAARLNRREYGSEITEEEAAEAAEMGLLIAFGASDDLLELRGVIHDEVGAFQGAEVQVGRDSEGHFVIEEPECELPRGYAEPKPIATITAVWSPEEDGLWDTSWFITSSAPHSGFKVMEGDTLYCFGIVADLTEAAREK